MDFTKAFKRYELKYIINSEQREIIKKVIEEHMQTDKYGKSTICNIYYDTPDFRLIRNSIEKPVYKEKLRVRSYGTPTPESTVFVELKKKYKSVVYKRRINTDENTAYRLLNGKKLIDTQIAREIYYFTDYYAPLSPAMYISYEREAYFSGEFRITFDSNLLWRDYDLTLSAGNYGRNIIDKDLSIMEIKTSYAIPLWLSHILNQNHIYKTPFSKYGTAYKTVLKEKCNNA